MKEKCISAEDIDRHLAEFYYFDRNVIDSTFRSQPPGSLHVDRFLQGKDYWQALVASGIKKRKTLILADWRAPKWSREKTIIVQKNINYLLATGFLIYAYQAGRLISLDEESVEQLHEPEFLDNMTAVSANRLIELANRKLGLTHDEIHILDDYWLDYLEEKPDTLPIRRLNIEELAQYDNKDKIVSILKKATPPLISFIDRDDNHLNKTRTFCSTEYPDIKFEDIYLILSLDLVNNSKALLQEITSKNLMVIEQVIISPIDYQGYHGVPLNIEYFSGLIKQIPNIKKLTIANCNDINSLFKIINLPCLEELSIYDSEFNLSEENGTIVSLKKLSVVRSTISTTPTFPNLSSMRLDDCSFDKAIDLFKISHLVDYFSIANMACDNLIIGANKIKAIDINSCRSTKKIEAVFSEVEDIYIYNCFESFIIQFNLCHENNGIKKIKFEQCSFDDDMDTNYELPKLSQLSILDSAISIKRFNKFISKAENVKKIKIISDVALKDNADSMMDFTLNHLKSLCVSRTQININQLHALLSKSSNIEDLNISFCPSLYTGNLPLCVLPNLIRLQASHSSISRNNFFSLIKNSPQIKEIEINNCIEFNNSSYVKDHSAELNNFHNIRLFKSHETYLSSKDLTLLLGQSECLKELSVGVETIESNVNLSKLKSLHLCQTKFDSPYQLHSFLSRSPNIETITIEKTCNWPDHLWLKPLVLPNLKTLEIVDSSIHIQFLLDIILSAENFRKISIKRMSNSFYDDSSIPEGIVIVDDNLININHLNNILNKINKLTHLIVINCNNFKVNTGDTIDLTNIGRLTWLQISSSNFSQHIEPILKKTPNLRELFLYENDDLPLRFSEPVFLPNLIEMDMDDCNTERPSGLSVQEINRFECNSLSNIYAKLHIDSCCYSDEDEDEWDISDTEENDETSCDAFFDASTDLEEDLSYFVTRVFFPVGRSKINYPVDRYRESIYDQVKINEDECDEESVFIAFENKLNTADLVINPNNVQKCADVWSLSRLLLQPDDYQYGRQDFYLTEKWQAIASLSPFETMTHYQVSNQPDSVLIAYDTKSNRYYIKTDAKPFHATLDFILNVPVVTYQLTKEFNDLLNDYQNFQAGALNIAVKNPTGIDYVEAMRKQRKGACRHRSTLFMLDSRYTSRLITNSCHAFVEVNVGNDQWITCDLGGYPAELNLDETLKPTGPLKEIKTKGILEQQTELNSHSNPMLSYWQRQFNFVAEPSQDITLDQFFDNLLAAPKKAQLIELNSLADVQALTISLQQHCQQSGYRYFYAHKPEDLICSAPFLQYLPDGTGQLKPAPGGLFYDFLTQNQDEPSIILVNYDNFSASDIVRFNGLLDKQRKADGIDVADCFKVIGWMNITKPGCYQERDFTSRFDGIIKGLFLSKLLSHVISPLPMVSAGDNHEVIALDNANDWKERLLGRWIIQKKNLTFIEGMLPKALQTGQPIVLQNAPWNHPEFNYFWREAWSRKQISYPAGTLRIPDTLQLVRMDGYDWEPLKPFLSVSYQLADHYQVLNPSTFSQFFTRYVCDNMDKQLTTEPGWIEAASSQHLYVTLTRSLSLDEWAMLLTRCKTYGVKLECYCCLGTALPEPLQVMIDDSMSMTSIEGRVLISSDVDTSLSIATNDDAYRIIIDVSECVPSDLLGKLNGSINPAELSFDFYQDRNFLQQALDDEDVVILKGHFSPELVDSLAGLLLKKTINLTIISNETTLFDFIQPVRQIISVADKKAELRRYFLEQDVMGLDDGLIEQSALSQLIARLNYLRHHSNASSDQTWQGLLSLPADIRFPAFDSKDVTLIDRRCNDFIAKRRADVQRILSYAPYVFLTGLTGVGKTTFVQEALQSGTLYQGIEQLEAWANDSSDQQKNIFFDEDNLCQYNRSNFEGLFHKPAGMLINGKYYQLTPQHKVIFAGNPLNYGQGRQLAPLFARHGNALVFDPIPPEYIYKHMIKPVLWTVGLGQLPLSMVKIFLDVYVFTIGLSQKEVLLSPRDVQMMALLLATCFEYFYYDGMDLSHHARYYAWLIARQAVPQSLKAMIDNRFNVEEPHRVIPCHAQKPSSDFFITPSRYPLMAILQDLLKLRTLRQRVVEYDGQTAYGGLGGIIIEGNPGIGKSELVRHCLRASSSDFYEMPVSMSNDDKKNLLLKAFHEGAIVMIDEINSAPMMEHTLNALLMGRTPDGRRPLRPGFMIIGTQNPVSMAGRLKPSTALARRLMTIVLPDYPKEEMTMILEKQKVTPECAKHMVEAFQASSSKLVFRDLIKMASDPLKMAGYVVSYTEQSGETRLNHVAEHSQYALASIMADKGFFAQNLTGFKRPYEYNLEEPESKRPRDASELPNGM